MRKTVVLVAALAMLLFAPVIAVADDARWMSVEYRDHQQVTIPCSAGLLCTVSFARGEVLGDYFNSDPSRWKMQPAYSENRVAGSATAQLVVQSMSPGLRANMVIFARNSQRVYRLLFVSVKDERPLYASFVYASSVHRASSWLTSKPAPTSTPIPTLSHIVDAACAAEADSYTADGVVDRHGKVDPLLVALHPSRICHDFGHAYVVMPQSDTAEVDLPVPYEDTPVGVTQANYHYFAAERTFVIDSITDIVLRSTSGRRVIDMHLRRTATHG